MACCYCGHGRPYIRSVGQNGQVKLTFIDKQNQFCYYEQDGIGQLKNSMLLAFPINFCPYCGQKLYKNEEIVFVSEKWWDNKKYENAN